MTRVGHYFCRLATGHPSEARRLDPDPVSRRRQPEEKRQPEFGHGPSVCAEDRHSCDRDCRQGWWLYSKGGGGLCDRTDGQLGVHHAPFRGVPGDCLALVGLAPSVEITADEMGIYPMNGLSGTMVMRAVFVDRDGVLNRAMVRDGRPYPPSTLEPLEILPGVAQAVHQLRDAGFLVVGATNQPDVARHTQRHEVVETMNAHLMATMPITAVFV